MNDSEKIKEYIYYTQFKVGIFNCKKILVLASIQIQRVKVRPKLGYFL